MGGEESKIQQRNKGRQANPRRQKVNGNDQQTQCQRKRKKEHEHESAKEKKKASDQ